MGWTLIVSQDEDFQREAMARIGTGRLAVGATGEAAACGLVRAIEVEQILVDALDDVGRQFLGLLRQLPARRFPDVVAVDPTGRSPKFRNSPSLANALAPQELGVAV